MTQLRDLTGQRFGRLTVEYRAEDRTSPSRKSVYWHCKCDCGNEKDIAASSLIKGHATSCGCYSYEIRFKTNTFIKKDGYYEGYTNYGDLYLFSEEDYEKVSKYSWRKRPDGYFTATVKKDKKSYPILLHRLIMNCLDDTCVWVDHIHGSDSKYDNRRENLRLSDSVHNGMNKELSSRNKTSGVTGVCWSSKDKRWVAYIGVNKTTIHLGQYINIEDAIKARKEAEEKYFGEWSYDNSRNNN